MTLMDTTLLPSEFSDLEPFAAKWCLATERERYATGWPAPWTRCRRSTTQPCPGPTRP